MSRTYNQLVVNMFLFKFEDIAVKAAKSSPLPLDIVSVAHRLGADESKERLEA
jgi:hypothetical protein